MKSYNETVNNVFRRMDEYETVQKRKRKTISRTVTGLCCACMIAVIGIGVNNIMTSPPLDNEQTESNKDNLGVLNTDQPANLQNNAGSALPLKQVVRSYPCTEPERYVLPKNGEKLITKPLYTAMDKYQDNVVYEIEVYLLKNAEEYLNNEAEWLEEYDRISKAMKDEQLGLSTSNDGNGQKSYMLLGVISKDFIDNFPVSNQYGYYITLSGGTDECTAQEPSIDVYNGKASQK